MGSILQNTTDYDSVRYALGVDTTVVSDSLVTALNFLTYVEGEVKEAVTDWATIVAANNQDTTRLKLGVAYWVAARICGYLERPESLDYRLAEYTHRPTDVDWMAKANELMAEAAKMLARLSTQTPAGRVTLFKRSGPTRSRSNVPADWETWLDKIKPTVLNWLEDEQT